MRTSVSARASWMPLLCACILLGIASDGLADSSIDSAHPYAYAANLGWVNVRADITNGAVIGQYYCTGYVWSANCGWIGLGSGPTNGWRYSNAAPNDWGVNHDGAGNLSGCAWAANVGWVALEQTYGQPRADLRTGNLSGYAWGANVGWISLSNVQACVRMETLSPGPDSDNDRVPDAYEYRYTNTLTVLSGLNGHDADGDGAADLEESAADSDPLDPLNCLSIISLAAGGVTNWVAWTARPTRLYRLEVANTLVGVGNWTDAGSGLLGPPVVSPVTQTLSGVTATASFYRVRAIMPLAQ